MELSLCLVNDIELILFQTECALAALRMYWYIGHERMYSLMFSLMERFLYHQVLQENTILAKLMRIDLNKESNLPTTSVNAGSGCKKRLKGFLTTNTLEM